VAEIASASQEQSAGIDQINKALNQMDEVTQQNSALVEENAASAKTLEHQAKVVDERVAFFRLDRADSRTAPGAATRSTMNNGSADGPTSVGATLARTGNLKVV
jgi:hypothetical protein